MLIESTTVQRHATWHFAGLGSLHSWAQERPWTNEGGLAVLRVPSHSDPSALLIGTRRLLGSYIDGPGVAISDIALPMSQNERALPSSDWTRRLIGSEINWVAEGTMYELKWALAQSLRGRPRLFIVPARSGDDVLQLQKLVEFCAKQVPPSAFACLTWTSAAVHAGIDASVVVDARCGVLHEPTAMLWAAQTERDAFQQYLIRRIAWEAAGDINRVLNYERRLPQIEPEDGADNEIESAFLEIAEESGGPGGADIEALLRYINRTWTTSRNTDHLDSEAVSLADRGLLWRPSDLGTWMVPPWLSRIIAKKFSAPRRVWAVRRNLHCVPLSSAIFERCLQLELYLRETIISELGDCTIQEAKDSLGRYLSGHKNTRFCVYPKDDRAYPAVTTNDAWLFTDLGDVRARMRSIGTWSVSYAAAIETLNQIRNAVAHAHPPSWRQIRELRKLASQLERA